MTVSPTSEVLNGEITQEDEAEQDGRKRFNGYAFPTQGAPFSSDYGGRTARSRSRSPSSYDQDVRGRR
jgi:hypothetical protein